MRLLLIDASVFVSSLLEGDTHHGASQAFFAFLQQRAKETFLAVPATVILEVANVLTRFGKRREARQLANYFPTLETIAIDDSFVAQAVPVLPQVKLKTADAIIAIAAFHGKATLVSWDAKLLRESKRLVPALTPQEYLASRS